MNFIEALRRTWNLGFSAALAKPSASKQDAMLEADVQRVVAECEVDIRTAFETWAKDQWPADPPPVREFDGYYGDPILNDTWDAWQAASIQRVAAEYEAQPTSLPKDLQDAINHIHIVVSSSHLPGWKFNREAWAKVRAALNSAQTRSTTDGYFIGGPHATAIVHHIGHAEAVITALCGCTGDDADDYTVTDLAAAPQPPTEEP